jgi:hypothetical protein
VKLTSGAERRKRRRRPDGTFAGEGRTKHVVKEKGRGREKRLRE